METSEGPCGQLQPPPCNSAMQIVEPCSSELLLGGHTDSLASAGLCLGPASGILEGSQTQAEGGYDFCLHNKVYWLCQSKKQQTGS